MPMDSNTPVARYLEQRKDELLGELAKVSPSLTRELQGILTSIRALEIGVTEPGPYSGIKNASDAIFAHLKASTAYSLNRESLKQAVLMNGWGLFIARRELNVQDAIRFRVETKKQIIERKDGMLALKPGLEKF